MLETAIVSEEQRCEPGHCAVPVNWEGRTYWHGASSTREMKSRRAHSRRRGQRLCSGNRDSSRASLIDLCAAPGPYRDGALQLALMILRPEDAHALLKAVAQEPADHATLIKGSGVAGNPSFVAWLISKMKDDKSARGAGESFSLITGADLALLDLERKPPANFESGPNDNPDDPNVAMDPDESLPWPDPDRVEKWWSANAARFQKGTRYFVGAPSRATTASTS